MSQRSEFYRSRYFSRRVKNARKSYGGGWIPEGEFERLCAKEWRDYRLTTIIVGLLAIWFGLHLSGIDLF